MKKENAQKYKQGRKYAVSEKDTADKALTQEEHYNAEVN